MGLSAEFMAGAAFGAGACAGCLNQHDSAVWPHGGVPFWSWQQALPRTSLRDCGSAVFCCAECCTKNKGSVDVPVHRKTFLWVGAPTFCL